MARARRDEAPLCKPAPPCVECGAPAFLPCHACGVWLCADHGLTRLLITFCHKCAHKAGGTFYTHREVGTQRAARRQSGPPPKAPVPSIDASGWATLEAALAKKKGGD
jgi:hypothetical protein